MLTIDFSFRELEIFCKVVELESFSRAAEAVFLVQSIGKILISSQFYRNILFDISESIIVF